LRRRKRENAKTRKDVDLQLRGAFVSGTGRTSPDYVLRRRKLVDGLRGRRVAAALIVRGEDVRYLSGFTGEDSFLLLGRGLSVLVTDGRYGEQARRECPDLQIRLRSGPAGPEIAEVLEAAGKRSLALQAEAVSLAMADRLRGRLTGVRTEAVSDLSERLRICKDASELAAIRRAVRIAERALRGLLSGGLEGLQGRSERDVAGELDYRMRAAGADSSAFETIVASGANASKPHYRPGSRKIRAGECLLIDWGAKAGGYCSDLTRTYFTARIPAELARAYEVVRRAQAAAIAACRAGNRCSDVDAAARGVIEAAGYGEAFLHGTGHGVGLEIHESPGLGRTSKAVLAEGMVVTVEPGIYLPGVGGIRIEDDVLVGPAGPRRLSTLGRSRGSMLLK
jgi:Xaa-Pro aminopeptidase